MVDATDVAERLSGMYATFNIEGIVVGKNAGKMPAQRRGAPDTPFCKLTFMLVTGTGAPKTQDVSVPAEIDHEQFEVGKFVKLPITVNFFEGRLTFRAIDTNANARDVGQAARDPGRVTSRPNVTDMGKTTTTPKVA
jgi:hypothetical protein